MSLVDLDIQGSTTERNTDKSVCATAIMSQGVSNWEAVKSLVADALELAPEAREAFIKDRCNGNPTLLEEVRALVSAHDDSEGVIHGAADAWLGLSGRDTVSLAGSSIGRYRLERLLAEGASGAVYVAQQISPNRRVAIKLLRTAMPLLSAANRFRREAAALGRLQHPNIARIYESGVHRIDGAATATPFLAMEFVDGLPLNKYAREKQLTREQRIQLIIKVAQAVHSAHQQAVIHRDLKPANVLVDSSGEPKVLDFGIARIGEDESENTWQTTAGVLLGTPGYMSPEQASGDQNSVDVRSDVWSLGVMLYELLSEKLPLDVKGRTIPEIIRTLETTEPRRLGQVDASLRGDLETIASTALAKDKSLRYASAEAFANDLRNVLQYEPIAARPPSRWYRVRKTIRRNRAAAAFAGLFILTLIGATIFSSWALVRSRQQRDRAEATNDFLKGVIQQANPNIGGADMTIRQAVNIAERDLSQSFSREPVTEGDLRFTIGWTQFQLGDYVSAERNLSRSYDLLKQSLGENNERTLLSAARLVSAVEFNGKLDEAEALLNQQMPLADKSLGPRHYITLELLQSRAGIAADRMQYDRTDELYKEVIARTRQSLGDAAEQTFTAENNYVNQLNAQFRYAEAEAIMNSLLERGIARYGKNSPQLFYHRRVMLTAKKGLGKMTECEAEYRSLAQDARHALGADNTFTIDVEGDLADFLGRYNKTEEAIELGKSVMERRRRVDGANSEKSIEQELFLGFPLIARKQFSEGESLTRDTLERSRRVLGDQHVLTVRLEQSLAICLDGQGRHAEAEQLFREVMPRLEATLIGGQRSRLYVGAQIWFAICLSARQKFDEAHDQLKLAAKVAEEMQFVSELPRARREIARTYRLARQYKDAERVLLAAAEYDRGATDYRQYLTTVSALVDLYTEWQKPREVEKWRASTQPASTQSARS